jgi:hypothetical protein
MLQVLSSAEVGVEEFQFRSGTLSMVCSVRMASTFDMSNLLAILAEWDESESTSSCCTSVGPSVDSPHSLLFECGLEVESDVVETLFCQCDREDAIVKCLSCRSLFDLDTFYLGC